MSAPVLSIVLPTFNGSAYLEEAVASCQSQIFRDWEAIIVDDASTDATPEIIGRVSRADSRIRGLRHETNRKLPAALNTGFSQASGRYLTWTSDDNRYKPHALATLWRYLEDHPEVDVVYSGFQIVDDGGGLLLEVRAEKPSGLVCKNVVGPCFMYRRQVQLELRTYDESLFLAEDFDFWLRASCRFRLSPLSESLYEYRNHAASLTANRTSEIHAAHRRCLEKSLPRLPWTTPGVRALGWCNLAGLAWSGGNRRAGVGYLLHAARSSPVMTSLILGKVLLLGRRITYSAPLRVPSWLA